VEVQPPESGDALIDALRGAARDGDPMPDPVRRRIHSMFVLSALESGLSGAVGGLGRPLPPPLRGEP
jgi:hypothetical protein